MSSTKFCYYRKKKRWLFTGETVYFAYWIYAQLLQYIDYTELKTQGVQLIYLCKLLYHSYFSFQTMCCLSPCGNYVSCGSENGSVHIWNVYNGNTVATYSPYKFDSETLPVHGVNFHPVDNTIAFSHYGKNIPIYIYKYDATAKNSDCVNISKEQRTTGSRQKTKSFVSRNENCVQNKITFEDILHKIDQILLPEMRNYDLDYDTD